MVTVSNITQNLIEDNMLFQESVSVGIVNYTALAKIIKPDVERIFKNKVKLSTIIRSIQRYAEINREKHSIFHFNYFKGIKIDSNVLYIVVHTNYDTIDRIRSIYEKIDFKSGGFFNIFQGNLEIAIMTNREYKDMVLDFLAEEKITHTVENHSSINLSYTKDYSLTPGLIYSISRNIALENINVLNWFNTPQELTLIVHENDVMRCYNILNKMQKKNHMNNSLNESSTKKVIY